MTLSLFVSFSISAIQAPDHQSITGLESLEGLIQPGPIFARAANSVFVEVGATYSFDRIELEVKVLVAGRNSAVPMSLPCGSSVVIVIVWSPRFRILFRHGLTTP